MAMRAKSVCCIYRVPDFEVGEVPVAFVEVKDGQSATEQEILDFVKARVRSLSTHISGSKTLNRPALAGVLLSVRSRAIESSRTLKFLVRTACGCHAI
jgi:acyl-CoA synthetase (AMP-forming)/AMP-acid ligase II